MAFWLVVISSVVVLISNLNGQENTCLKPCLLDCTASMDVSPLCNCDKDCGVYGDCCHTTSPPQSCEDPSLSPLGPGVVLECLPTFTVEGVPVQGPGGAVRMVTSCPNTWTGENVSTNCLSDNLGLPPVTDTLTGLVYKNEYCAICNGREFLQAWHLTIACSPLAYIVIMQEGLSNVYEEDPFLLTRDCRSCAYQNPINVVFPPRSCIPSIKSCLNKTSLQTIMSRELTDTAYEQLVQDCLSGAQDTVESSDDSGTLFYNPACAFCNGISGGRLFCFTLSNKELSNMLPSECIPLNPTQPSATLWVNSTGMFEEEGTLVPETSPTTFQIPFGITVQTLERGRVSIRTPVYGQIEIASICIGQQVQVGFECYETLCPEIYSETGGRCSPFDIPPPNTSSINCTADIDNVEQFFALISSNITLAQHESILVSGNVSLQCRNISSTDSILERFLENCPLRSLHTNSLKFEESGDSRIIVYTGGRVDVYFNIYLVCFSNVNNATFTLPSGVEELVYAGCSISAFCNLLIFILYTTLAEFRVFPSVPLLNISVSIILSNMLFIAGVHAMQRSQDIDLCTGVAICLFFFYLSQLVWMSLFPLEMSRTLNLARKMVISSKRNQRLLLLMYMLAGWGLPLVVSVITIALNFSGTDLIRYGACGNSMACCWINHFVSSIIFYLIPLSICLVVCLLMLVAMIVLLVLSSKNKVQRPDHILLLQLWLTAFTFTVLTWAFGFVAIAYKASWAWYLFAILHSSQGIAMLISVVISRKALLFVKDLCKCQRSKTSSALRNKNSQISSGGIRVKHERDKSLVLRVMQSETHLTPPEIPPRPNSSFD